MPVTEVTSIDQFRQIINRNELSLVDFSADWAGSCKLMYPVVNDLANNYTGVRFYRVDVDALSEVSQLVGRFGVMPTFILFKGGAQVDSLAGANPSGLQTLVRSRAV